MSYKIFDFAELKFSKEYLRKLPKHHLMFLSASSVAGNDISVFAKLLLGFSYKPSDEKILREIASLHHWAIRRQLAAKIIEFVKLFERYIKNLERSKNNDDAAYSKILKSSISSLTSSAEYEMARNLRNQTTNHYMLENCLAAVENYPEGHKFRMLLSPQSGNSYFPLGEEVAHLTHFDPDINKGADLVKAIEWLHKTAGELIKLHHRSINRILSLYQPENPRKITVYVDDKLISTEGQILPILFFNGPNSRI